MLLLGTETSVMTFVVFLNSWQPTLPPIFFRLASSWSMMPTLVVRMIFPNCDNTICLSTHAHIILYFWLCHVAAMQKVGQRVIGTVVLLVT